MSNLQLTQEKLDALRSEYRPRRPCALLKYPRPKTKPEYQSIYPWIILDETDPHFVFCAVCECRLSAKRSDLGKHEGSIKHSENAQRKSVLLAKVKPETRGMGVKWEYNDEEEALLPMQFGAGAHLCKTEVDNEEDDAEAEAEADADADAEDEEAEAEADDDDDEAEADGDADGDGDGDGDAEADAENNSDYEPKSKRRLSDSDSQHSGLLDFLPLQVTINELPHVQLTPASQLTAQCQPASSTPQPCRITIKKVTAPLTKPAGTPLCTSQTQEITSKATITPIATGCYTPTARQAQLPSSYAARQLQSYQLQHLTSIEQPTRDSFDLFFDSICATVKSLPPKLATEGKIRVMQLIGELELRAINEREALPSASAASTPLDTSPSAGAGDAPGSSQQNATVASTTK